MEFVSGKTLDRLIPRHGLPLSEALNYSVQIAAALASAHRAGIVHRDLKPGNVMVNEQGLVKVLDFGLAKVAPNIRSGEPEAATQATRSEEHLTSPGAAVGTVAYMSPEQVKGKELDSRTDLFSFGVVLYEVMTGILPFRGDSAALVFDSILNVSADAGGPASFSQEPRRGLLSGAAARAQKLWPESAPDAHQQGGRSVPADVISTRSATHSGTIWCGLRSPALGLETRRARRKEREEASHRGDCEKAGGVVASSVGKWRGVRTAAQQQPNDSRGSRVKRQTNSKSFYEEKEQNQKPKAEFR